MGEAVDRGVIEKGSLVLRKRTMTQGPVTIEFESTGGKLDGSMKMGVTVLPQMNGATMTMELQK